MRPEFLFPEIDEDLLQELADLADQLDGCDPRIQPCQELVDTFNRKAGTELKLEDFSFYGAYNAEEFVYGVVKPIAIKRPDVTPEELCELFDGITEIWKSEAATKRDWGQADFWMEILELQTGYPEVLSLLESKMENPQHKTGELINLAIEEGKKRIIYLPERISDSE